MFCLPLFNRQMVSRSCGTVVLACTLLMAAAGNALAESAYYPMQKRDAGFELTDRSPRSGKWKKMWKWSARRWLLAVPWTSPAVGATRRPTACCGVPPGS